MAINCPVLVFLHCFTRQSSQTRQSNSRLPIPPIIRTYLLIKVYNKRLVCLLTLNAIYIE